MVVFRLRLDMGVLGVDLLQVRVRCYRLLAWPISVAGSVRLCFCHNSTQLLVMFSHSLLCFSYHVFNSPVVADPATLSCPSIILSHHPPHLSLPAHLLTSIPFPH